MEVDVTLIDAMIKALKGLNLTVSKKLNSVQRKLNKSAHSKYMQLFSPYMYISNLCNPSQRGSQSAQDEIRTVPSRIGIHAGI